MPAVPALTQIYPSIPLNELTSFYSVGDHAFSTTPAAGTNPAQTHRVAVLSYLPRTLMIYDDFQYNNKYILFVEALTQVTSVTWAFQLYLNGVETPAGTFVTADDTDPFEYNIQFRERVVDAGGIPLFDRMKITCSVVNGVETKTIELNHNFAKATNVINTGLFQDNSAFAGEPNTYNFMANQLKEYFPDDLLFWNGQDIEDSPFDRTDLLFITLGIIYYNIQVSPAMNAQLIKSFDWQNFTRTDLVTAINTNAAYTGNFRVGPGMIPLHVLSDAMTDVNTVPDFSNIPNNNKIYTVLSSVPPLSYNSVGPNPPDPVHVQQSKARLIANRSKLIALYHYATFPRSAIKMMAILVKFLMEASRKNSCKECKSRTVSFPFVTLASHRDTPDLMRNILTHYFRDPYNKIDAFAPEALKVANLSWSPYTYSLVHNVLPRILKAYFARRVVKKISDDFYEVNFERTDNLQFRNAAGNWILENGTQRYTPPVPKPAWDDFLGRETYLIVETWNCKGKTISCNIGVPAGTFNVSVNNNNMQVQMDAKFIYDIERNFEDYTAVNTSANQLPGNNQAVVTEYLKVNHSTKFIARIRLRPDTLANFEAWTNSLGTNSINLTIKTKLTNNANCLFGNNIQQTFTSGTFLDANDQYNDQLTYSIINRLVFEIQHEFNPWNFLQIAAVGDGRIGKVDNHFIRGIAAGSPNIAARRACFFYYDELGHEHYFFDYELQRPAWIPTANYGHSPYQDGKSCLIDVSTFYYKSLNVNLNLLDNTNGREYIDVACFAAMAGAMARNNILNLAYNGFSTKLGQSTQGSKSHKNGIRGDLRYIRTAADGAPCLLSAAEFNYNRQVDFNNSLHEYGWARRENMLSENFTRNGVPTLLPHCSHFHVVEINNNIYNSKTVANGELVLNGPSAGQVVNIGPVDHNDHLHVQGFDFARVSSLIF